METLTPSQFNRYARHISLAGVGIDGQRRLLAAKVLLVGLGGLGSPLLQYLAAAGVGILGLADGDRVEESNLQRQVLYGNDDCGRAKNELAGVRAAALNSDVKTRLHPKLTATNVAKTIAAYDIIADCSDNFTCRYLLSEAAAAAKKPLVAAALSRFEGQVGVFTPWLGKGHPCYQCIFQSPPTQPGGNCSSDGILGAVAGAVGCIQAIEVLKLIVNLPTVNDGLLLYDCIAATSKRLKASRSADCPSCKRLGY